MYSNYHMIQELIYTAPAVLLAISFHEFAHGYVSHKLGDPTPAMDGRLTLNPFRHLDLLGTISLLIFRMGWAKPVRVNTRYYQNKKRDMILVALAGPLSNFLLAFVSLCVYGLIIKFSFGGGSVVLGYIGTLCFYISMINVGLGVFNLIPLPPLDGSAVLSELGGGKVAQFYARIRPYAPILLVGLLVTGVLSRPIGLLNQTIINAFWTVVRLVLGLGVPGGTTIL